MREIIKDTNFWKNKPLFCRFANSYEIEEGKCWNWQGSFQSRGYGQIMDNYKQVFVHRYSWKLSNGPIPDGLCILHKCDNTTCVNPDHLFLGTNKDNSIDMSNKGRHANSKKTHCPNGHEYNEKNTYLWLKKDGKSDRSCRTCRRDRKRAARRSKAKYLRALAK